MFKRSVLIIWIVALTVLAFLALVLPIFFRNFNYPVGIAATPAPDQGTNRELATSNEVSPKVEVVGWREYVNRKYGFSFKHPDMYEICCVYKENLPGNPEVVISLAKPGAYKDGRVTDGFTIVVRLNKDSWGGFLTDEGQAFEKNYRKYFDDNPPNIVTGISLGGKSVGWQKAKTWSVVHFPFQFNKYTLTILESHTTDPKFEETFKQIAKTFRLEDEKLLDQSGRQVYRNNKYSFELALPVGWTLNEDNWGGDNAFLYPSKIDQNPYLPVKVHSFRERKLDFQRRTFEGIGSMAPYQATCRQNILLDGREADLYLWEGGVPWLSIYGNNDVIVNIRFAPGSDNYLAVSLPEDCKKEGLSKILKDKMPKFSEITESFRFIER